MQSKTVAPPRRLPGLNQESIMTKYIVAANDLEFGTYEADTEQEARDLCAQDAGYKSEADMEDQLGQPSELVAEIAE